MRIGGKLTLAAVGKLRTKHWRIAQDEYVKRLRHYTLLEITEVRDALHPSVSEEVAMEREGGELLQATAAVRYRVALHPRGKLMRSRAFAGKLRQWIEVYGNVGFLIGGPLGLSEGALEACDMQLSLSPLTFPHEMARVILLEQLYRAATILSGESYHK